MSSASATFPGKNGRIAFVREGNHRGIYTVREFEAGLTRLTDGEDYGPAWSPDGTRVAFQRFHGGGAHSDIYVMNADGTHLQRLTRRGGFQPDWSPMGARSSSGAVATATMTSS
jgi:Tol biopolymer transport system component